jgi:hypothetical protein
VYISFFFCVHRAIHCPLLFSSRTYCVTACRHSLTTQLTHPSPSHPPLRAGTPVTAETFKVWQQAKAARKQADAVARMKAEEKKKGKGGKGCTCRVLSCFVWFSFVFFYLLLSFHAVSVCLCLSLICLYTCLYSCVCICPMTYDCFSCLLHE